VVLGLILLRRATLQDIVGPFVTGCSANGITAENYNKMVPIF